MILKTNEIRIRDPFIHVQRDEKLYYLFGTTDKSCWKGAGVGFDCYTSPDLDKWKGPQPAFRAPDDFWGTKQFWAPEVHKYRDRFYMFASFKSDKCYRGTQILESDRPEGPYRALTDRAVTPPSWECLDGTLHIDDEGSPWIVFCHEWTQVHNGTICAMRLTEDLKEAGGSVIHLISGSDAPWSRSTHKGFGHGLIRGKSFPCFVTDGPFLHRTEEGHLLMLWSSFADQGYAMGIARSSSGRIEGPWLHEEAPIWKKDGGHGMIFRSLDNRLLMTLHQPNRTPLERASFIEIEEREGSLRIRS